MAQKSILSILQTAASELSIPVPVTVVSSQDTNHTKLRAFLVATCDDLLAEHDWQELITRYQFTTVSGQGAYPLPADLFRFIDGTFFDKNNRWPLSGPKTATEWEFLNNVTYLTGPFNRFRVFGNEFNVLPVPSTTQYTFVFEYFSSNYAKDGSTGEPKAEFTQDSDVCLFDHRLVVYGIKAKWLASLGQDDTAALAEYTRALSSAKGRNAPSKRLSLVGGDGHRLLSTANLPEGNWS